MSAVVKAVKSVVNTVVDAVGDAVEAVGNVVEKVVDKVGDVVQAVIENPLPVLLSVAGMAIGIPPMLTNAVVTAAQGGDLGDIVLSAGVGYLAPVATNAISSTLSATIGDAIVNEAISDAVVNGVSKGLVNGVISEVKGGDFEDGFAGGFTGSVVGAGVNEVSDFVKPDIIDAMNEAGLDTSTATAIANAGTKALTSGLTAEITGRGDFATSFTNSLVTSGANAAANVTTNTIADQFSNATAIDNQITGADNGNTKDQEELKTELANAWDNRDINTVNDIITNNNITEDDARTLFDLTDSDIFGLQDNGVSFSTGDDTKTTTALTNNDTGETVGTGAGIPASLVDEVEVSDLGDDSGTATDVVSNLDTTYTTNDMAGTDSVATISGSNTESLTTDNADVANAGENSWLDVPGGTADFDAELQSRISGTGDQFAAATDLFGYEDLPELGDTDVISGEELDDTSDIGLGAVSDEDLGAGDITQIEQQPTATQYPEEDIGDLPDEYKDIINKITSTGTLDQDAISALASAGMDRDTINSLIGATQPNITVAPEEQAPEFKTGIEEEEKPVIGGLGALGQTGASLLPTAAGTGVMGSVLNQVLKPAIQKSITKSLIKPTRPAPKPRPAPKTGMQARPAPKLTSQQLASMSKKPTTPTVKKPVAPTKANVKSLTPVSNIAGLTSILKKKG